MVEDIMQNIEELAGDIKTIDDAINTALTIETQGRNFYLEKSETSTSISAKDLFLYLAAEEDGHIDYLKEFLKYGRTLSIHENNPPDFSQSFASEYSSENPAEMDVLLGALRFEQKNEKFYQKLAAQVDDPEQKAFFEKMSVFEHGHMELIDGFIEDASQFRMQT
ncbi:MAG: ferritin family protein [ANME-2 cluster archaeon]|nr:ferritin family protein [ANME-2 cluster archaeon]